jgi:ketopantoate reductase
MSEVVVIGLGQLGALFAHGFLALGRTVVPVLRGTRADDVARDHPAPELVLIAVAEDDLAPVLANLPAGWRDRVSLLQNELVPSSWRDHGIERPTVAVVWFEKKPGRPVRELLPTIVYGQNAKLLAAALEKLAISSIAVKAEHELVRALVEKNLYILVTNIAGLEAGGSVRELWRDRRALAEAVADDVITLQQALTSTAFPRPELIAALERAIMADPEHSAMGRSAPARLQRALRSADALGLELGTLRRISADRS